MSDKNVHREGVLELVIYPEVSREFAEASSSAFKLAWCTSFPPAAIPTCEVNALFDPQIIYEKITAAKSRTARFSGIIALTDAYDKKSAVGAGWVVEDTMGGRWDRWQQRHAPRPVRLERLGVSRGYQDRGIGSIALMELLIDFNEDQPISISLPVTNQIAMGWFSRRGFSHPNGDSPADSSDCSPMCSTVGLVRSSISADLSAWNAGSLPAYKSTMYTPPARSFKEKISNLIPEPPKF